MVDLEGAVEIEVDGVADVVGEEAARAQDRELAPEDVDGAGLKKSSDEPMRTTRPPGPPIAIACSSTAADPTHWMTTSGPKPPVSALHRRDHVVAIGRDGLVGAELRARASFASDRVTAMTRAPNALPSWTAFDPSPPTPRTTSVSPRLEPGDALQAMERRRDGIGQDREDRGRHGGAGLDQRGRRAQDVLRERAVHVDAHARDVGRDVRSPASRPRIAVRDA